jgi:hypothetical protein
VIVDGGSNDLNDDEKISASIRSEVGRTSSGQTKLLPTLNACGDPHFYRPVYRGDVDTTSQRGLGERNGYGAEEIVALARVKGVGSHMYENV